ncbi:MAG: hypothetical protein KAJ66_01660 [Candidatus Omnitrophica bacterium]|nr:hypothetical protein [Candidatus Omnitrophota bacterium]
MSQKPKIRMVSNKNDKGLIYFFKDRAQFERCIASGCKLISPENAHDASELISSIELISLFAIEMWRLDKRISKASENAIDNSIVDQIRRIKDIFKKQDIEIVEHANTDYNDGMSVKVLHVEEVDNLPYGKMNMLETVKPSVYFKGKIISHGEVIVGKSKEKAKKE